LGKIQGHNAYHIGALRNQDILSGFDHTIVKATDNLTEANFILLTAYLDEGEDLNQFKQLFSQALELKLPAICANPDKIIPNGNKKRYCAGVLAEQYKAMGGEVYYYGKPDVKVFELAYSQLEQQVIDKSRVAMIGDTIDTDILGANNFGIDSIMVLTGNGASLVRYESELHINLSAAYNTYGILPKWVINKLSL
jgi:HAD superfamily hydrolase (TIGR01459 family)